MTELHITLSDSLASKLCLRQFSIDCGTKLSKFIYFDNGHEKAFKTQVFPTVDLEKNLKNLSEFIDVDQVHLTGNQSSYAKTIVTSLLPVEVVFVDEIEALSLGFRSIIENLTEHDVLYKVETNILDENLYKVDMNNPIIKKMKQKMDSTFDNATTSNDNKIKRPSILIWGGSYIKFYLMKSDGATELIGASLLGGETFRGISKCLTDINDYQTITGLAYEGRRQNVDTQVYEIFNEDPHSPYGKFPPQMPIFPFGKCSDYQLNKEDLKVEDTMESWSNLAMVEALSIATKMCQIYKVNSIYIGGGMFLAPVFAKIIEIRNKIAFTKMSLSVLDCNYVFALGALLKD